MTSVSERIKMILARTGLRQNQLAQHLHVTPQTVTNWIKRDSISKDAAQQIAFMFGYSLDWILKGVGDEEPARPLIEGDIRCESEAEDDYWGRDIPINDDEAEVHFLKDIEFACGDGSYGSEDHNGIMLRLPKAILRKAGANTSGIGVLCFPVTGNSMEPIIPDGSTVAVDTANKKIIDGKLYAINHGGLKRIKQLYRMPGRMLSVRSFNKDEYPEQTVAETEIEVIGKVFWYSVTL